MKSNRNMTNLAAQEAVLGTNLRKLRLSRQPRLSQKKLAEKLGVCRTTYARYEKGQGQPPDVFVRKAAKFYKLPVNDLYQECSENPPDTAIMKATA